MAFTVGIVRNGSGLLSSLLSSGRRYGKVGLGKLAIWEMSDRAMSHGTHDPETGELERQKLAMEIRELEKRVEVADKQLRWEKGRFTLNFIAIFVTALVGLIGALFEFANYLDQREREQRFEVTQEMISLVEQLNRQEHPALQSDAALELAAIGLPAVPNLINHLRIEHFDEVHDAIIRALTEIINSPEAASQVMRQLKPFAVDIVQAQIDSGKPKLRRIRLQIRALGEIGVRGEAKHTSGIRPRIVAALKEIEQIINSDRKIPDEKRNELLELAEKYIAKLTP